MNHALEEHFPGVEFNFSQYIADNVEEASGAMQEAQRKVAETVQISAGYRLEWVWSSATWRMRWED